MSSVIGLNGAKDGKTKEERVRDFVKSLSAIEQAIEPFKEQLRDLKKNYVSNKWLDKKDLKLALKAYRLVKDDTDIGELESMFKKVSGGN
jgi:hypothetical protein